MAVLSDEPIRSLETPNIPKTFTSPSEATATIERLRDELRHGYARSGGGRPNWSVELYEYTIRE